MRELRFLVPGHRRSALLRSLTASAGPLLYRVTNFYLDDPERRFSQTGPGSPRFRVRLYEAGPWRFGQIELKSVGPGEDRRKRVWSLSPYREALAAVVPLLGEGALGPPPQESPYGCLVRPDDPGEPELRGIRFLTALSYQRASFQNGPGRLTLDSDFSPSLLPDDGSLLEIKGGFPEARLATLRKAFSLSVLEKSKFALLMGAPE
jgi:hypothetical protein